MTTVIIPAHNEETTILRCLEALHTPYTSNKPPIDIVVSCNGCSDNTAELVRQHFPMVTCIEQATASKIAAIRAAEKIAISKPYIYLDADIKLSRASLNQLTKASQANTGKLIVPRSMTITEHSSYWVRAYYRHWYLTPGVLKLGFGSGVYVLNEKARSQFNHWPDIISDDGFVRTFFNDDDIVIVDTAISEVTAPAKLNHLLAIKRRSKFGNLEIRAKLNNDLSGAMKQTSKRRPFTHLNRYLSRSIVDSSIYIAINVLALILAKYSLWRGQYVWHRDTSSR